MMHIEPEQLKQIEQSLQTAKQALLSSQAAIERAEATVAAKDALIAELVAALEGFVTEHRANQSPECEECEIVGPLLREADAALARAKDQS